MHLTNPLAWFAVMFGTMGCARESVVRVYEGRVREERPIDALAYREHLVAAEHEARGDLDAAAHAYRRALEVDPSNVEAWVSLGAVECRRGRDPSEPFAEAATLNPGYAPLWLERARCSRVHGALDVEAAERAFRLDPDAESNVLELATSLVARGRPEEALRFVRERARGRAPSRGVLELLARAARQAGDVAWAGWASRQLARLGERQAGRDPNDASVEGVPWSGLAGEGDDEVRRWASRRRLSRAEGAALFVILGRPEVALFDLRPVLLLEPGSLEERLVAVLAAELAGSPEPTLLATGITWASLPKGGVGEGALVALLRRHRRVMLDVVLDEGASSGEVLGRLLARCLATSCEPKPFPR
jgi:Flp pilus assembly protein TadD